MKLLTSRPPEPTSMLEGRLVLGAILLEAVFPPAAFVETFLEETMETVTRQSRQFPPSSTSRRRCCWRHIAYLVTATGYELNMKTLNLSKKAKLDLQVFFPLILLESEIAFSVSVFFPIETGFRQ